MTAVKVDEEAKSRVEELQAERRLRADRLGTRLQGAAEFPDAFERLHVSRARFDEAVEIFERDTDQQLSFTDATLVAQVHNRDIDTLLSFDDDFDGLVDRTDPEELAPEHNP